MIKSLLRLFWKKSTKKVSKKWSRFLPVGDYIVDRWEKAQILGFGQGSSVYDNSVILGNVTVGENTWIGPNTVLDGSGNLKIGSNCSISAGVQIYTHDSIMWAVSGGTSEYEYAATTIEDNCYIGPNSVITMGVIIEAGSIIGANSFVNKNVESKTKVAGNPAREI